MSIHINGREEDGFHLIVSELIRGKMGSYQHLQRINAEGNLTISLLNPFILWDRFCQLKCIFLKCLDTLHMVLLFINHFIFTHKENVTVHSVVMKSGQRHLVVKSNHGKK